MPEIRVMASVGCHALIKPLIATEPQVDYLRPAPLPTSEKPTTHMKNTTKVAIVGLLSAAGSLLNAFALEFAGDALEAAEPPAPKKGKKATPPPVETPTETTATDVATAEEPVATEGGGKTYEELRAIIEPLVKGGQGEEVKKVIAKYSQAGLKGIEAKHHAAFEKDIQGLAY